MVGDLHVAPGPVYVEEHEDGGRTVAKVLIVPARATTGRRGTRYAGLANQLSRRFVETNDRKIWILGFGVEIENVLHPRDVLGIDLRNAPHLPLPWLQLVLSEATAHRFARQSLVAGQANHTTCQQLQRPARAALRRSRACNRHQKCFLLRCQLPLAARTRLLRQRSFKALLDESPLGPEHRRCADRYTGRNLLVGRPRVCSEQHLGSLDPAHLLAAY